MGLALHVPLMRSFLATNSAWTASNGQSPSQPGPRSTFGSFATEVCEQSRLPIWAYVVVARHNQDRRNAAA